MQIVKCAWKRLKAPGTTCYIDWQSGRSCHLWAADFVGAPPDFLASRDVASSGMQRQWEGDSDSFYLSFGRQLSKNSCQSTHTSSQGACWGVDRSPILQYVQPKHSTRSCPALRFCVNLLRVGSNDLRFALSADLVRCTPFVSALAQRRSSANLHSFVLCFLLFLVVSCWPVSVQPLQHVCSTTDQQRPPGAARTGSRQNFDTWASQQLEETIRNFKEL